MIYYLFTYLQPFNLLANSNIEIMGEKNQTLENRQKKDAQIRSVFSYFSGFAFLFSH